jgi:hypothetical protein
VDKLKNNFQRATVRISRQELLCMLKNIFIGARPAQELEDWQLKPLLYKVN